MSKYRPSIEEHVFERLAVKSGFPVGFVGLHKDCGGKLYVKHTTSRMWGITEVTTCDKCDLYVLDDHSLGCGYAEEGTYVIK